MAQKDTSKGGPASGLVDKMLLPGGDTDVFYWLGEATRLPNDGQKEFEEEERRVITKIIHEEIHHEFQGNNPVFLDVLNKAGGDEKIIIMRTALMKNQLGYLEPEVELTAYILTNMPTVDYRRTFLKRVFQFMRQLCFESMKKDFTKLPKR